jgi:flavorubredoxin
VHWPETISTYLREDKILFSCDFFGSHFATSDLFACCEIKLYSGAKRYYAEIMMPFRKLIQGHLKKLEKYEIKYIAASHGPVYNTPEFIIDAYKEWTSDAVKPEVIIAHISMHGSTDKMVERMVSALEKHGMKVKPYNLSKTDIGELAMDLVDASAIVIATPYVLAGPHPKALEIAYLAGALRPKTKLAAIMCSYGWGGQGVEILKSVMPGLQAELLPPLMVKGLPREADYKAVEELAEAIVKKHRELNLIK